jgi:hypothetical protein
MIIIPYHEEKQETHSECNYFGTDVASCVHIHPTATPNNPTLPAAKFVTPELTKFIIDQTSKHSN